MKKKVKRYVTGDFVDYDSSDDARNLLRAAERETREFKGMDTDVIDETGMKSRLKRNMETGELYDPTGEIMTAKARATPRGRATPRAEAPSRVSERIAERIEEGMSASGMPREARGAVAGAEPRPSAPRSTSYAEAAKSGRNLSNLLKSGAEDREKFAKDVREGREKTLGTKLQEFGSRFKRALMTGRPQGEGMKKGGVVKKASSASKRADGIAQRGKTRGRMI